MAERETYNIKEIRRESHSTKMSGQRSVFNQLLTDIQSGVFNGILTWAPNRLSRNAGAQNPFYTGEFEYPIGSGKWYQGKHKPLIIKDVFDKIQMKLIVPKKSKWGAKKFNFKDIFKCVCCGASIIGEDKLRKRNWRDPKYHIYYHCTKQRNYDCPEPYINQEKLVKEIIRYLNFMEMAHPQIFKISEKLKRSTQVYKEIRDQILLQQNVDPDEKPLTITEYSKHCLINGATQEKREVIQSLNRQLYIHDKSVTSSPLDVVVIG